MMYLKIAIVAIMLAGGAGAFIYVKTLQADLAMSEANNAKLEQSVESQKAVIEADLFISIGSSLATGDLKLLMLDHTL